MELKRLAFVVLLACRPVTHETRVLLSSSECGCPCADAGVDAAPDAPLDAPAGPPPIDLAAPWTRHVLIAGSTAGIYRGADGVAQDSEGCWWTPWEEGGAVTRVCGTAAVPVPELVASSLVGAEDVKPGDFDGDGTVDGAIAVDAANGGVYLAFRAPGGSAAIAALGASMGHGHAQQIAVADVDQDGDLDLYLGTRAGTPAVTAWLENPGGTDARIGLLWGYHEISKAGWIMSLVPVIAGGPPGLVVSDRASYKDASGVTRWDLYGARWLHQISGAWTSVPIGQPAGSCNPYTSPTCTRTPGDEMMLDVAADASGGVTGFVDCQSSGSQVDSRVVIHDLAAGTHVLVPPVPNVGHCQHVISMDVDLDSDQDIVVSTWGADGGRSGVYWLRAPEWSRGEVSGEDGTKFDNLARYGARCVITTEQIEQLGVVVYCPAGVAP